MRERDRLMRICKADKEDLNEILQLQYLAYQSEAALFGTKDIPPLKQTLEEVEAEYDAGVILKMIPDEGANCDGEADGASASTEGARIIGSVRGREESGTVYIGKFMVHPDFRGRGLGTALLTAIEKLFPGKRLELFTSTRSVDNIRLYEKNGYKIFDRKDIDDDLTFVYLEKGL